MFNLDILLELIDKAKGDRTQNAFALKCGFDSSALSKIKSRGVPPQPALLQKIATHARNGVTYEELMCAAGYLDKINKSKENYLDEPIYVQPPVLDGVYYRLAQEAKDKGILPEDVEKIIEIFNKYKS